MYWGLFAENNPLLFYNYIILAKNIPYIYKNKAFFFLSLLQYLNNRCYMKLFS